MSKNPKNMKILVACEESGRITEAFRDRGHNAWSCDLMYTSGNLPQYHIKGDALKLLNDGWDMLIAHPPCDYLTNSGVSHMMRSASDYANPNPNVLYGIPRWVAMYEGAMFFNEFINAPVKRICVENPIPHRYARGYIGKYTQIVQPWMFGHMETKATCLWLKGLPKLVETKNVKAAMMKLSKKERSKCHYASPGPDRNKIRSRTLPGLAVAIAAQWG